MKSLTLFLLTSMTALFANTALADDRVRPVQAAMLSTQSSGDPAVQRAALARVAADLNQVQSFQLDRGYALGVSRFDVDSHTEIIGWKLSHSIYFGAQDGEDSGLSIVWQKDVNQVSLSKEGLRLTRRF